MEGLLRRRSSVWGSRLVPLHFSVLGCLNLLLRGCFALAADVAVGGAVRTANEGWGRGQSNEQCEDASRKERLRRVGNAIRHRGF